MPHDGTDSTENDEETRMALLASQAVQITGPAITLSAPNASETVVPDDRSFYWIKTGATGTTVTVVVPGTTFAQNNPDVAVVIGTSTERMIGPLVSGLADPATGLITITTSSQATCTAAVVRI